MTNAYETPEYIAMKADRKAQMANLRDELVGAVDRAEDELRKAQERLDAFNLVFSDYES